jgi:UDP-N-acetylglucosamine 2-epimerase (non-hydrolysing)
LALQCKAAVVITDSVGIQEETTFLGVRSLTVRENTERPITVTSGTNLLVGRDISPLQAETRRILAGEKKCPTAIPLWDGHAAERIADVILRAL